MQPPIPMGTVLQNRYRVLSILGQGGFGRTYLAEDQGRFNERCALKEFIPPQGSTYALNKSRELFQREAAILYQIQHSQIPQFRATFEENKRLFLVQDYVDGKTYRMLLNDRKAQNYTFSESEVLQLLRQLLPVLDYIHSKGIIHRDIAPDNIILRQQDSLPVLIDFGVVKEIATRVQSPDVTTEPTTVGKLGYAPIEQIQTGRAYPSSDLYALAVTSLVLLTGRDPQELYDDRNLTWNWQRWANVSPKLAQLLNRMLSYRPGDRYQSAPEVLQVLQPSAGAPVPAPAPAPGISNMRTVAVGRAPDPIPVAPPSPPLARVPERPQPVVPQPDRGGSAWDNPLALIATAAGLAIVAGITTWAIVSALRNPAQVASPTPSASATVTITPTPTPSTTPTPTPTPTPSATPSSQPIEYSQRLDLKPTGETTTAEGNLRSNETITYVIPAQQGQTLSATLGGEGTLLTVLAPNRQPVDDKADRVSSWQGTLSDSGDYQVRVSPVKGVDNSDYKLSLALQPAASPSPTPTVSPSATPVNPVIDQQPLAPPVNTPIQFSDRTAPNTVKRYAIKVESGQVLKVEVLQGAVTLDIRYPDGRLVENASGVVSWSHQITESGQYLVDVLATDPANFALKVEISQQPQ